jgi:hypothetical protein
MTTPSTANTGRFAWAQELPRRSYPPFDPTSTIIDRAELQNVLADIAPEVTQSIVDDLDFLEENLVPLFRSRHYEARRELNRYRFNQLIISVVALTMILMSVLQLVALISAIQFLLVAAFLTTLVALTLTFLTTLVSRSQSPVISWLTNQRRAEALRREYYRFVLDLPPYHNLRDLKRKKLLAVRAADIDQGIEVEEAGEVRTGNVGFSTRLDREHMYALYSLFDHFVVHDQRALYQRFLATSYRAVNQINTIRAFSALLTGFLAAMAGLLVSAYLVEGSFANQGACATLLSSRTLVAGLRDLGVIEGIEGIEEIGSLQPLSVQREPEAEGAPIDSVAVGAAVADLIAIQSSNCDLIQGVVNFLMVMAVVTSSITVIFTMLYSIYQWDRFAGIYESSLNNLDVLDSYSPVGMLSNRAYRDTLSIYAVNVLSGMREFAAQWGQPIRTAEEIQSLMREDIPASNEIVSSNGEG